MRDPSPDREAPTQAFEVELGERITAVIGCLNMAPALKKVTLKWYDSEDTDDSREKFEHYQFRFLVELTEKKPDLGFDTESNFSEKGAQHDVDSIIEKMRQEFEDRETNGYQFR